MANTKRNRAILSGASLLTVALVAIQPASAQDGTVSSTFPVGVDWDATVYPGTNLTITSTGTIISSDPYALTIIGTAGSTLGSLVNDGAIISSAITGSAIDIGTVSMAGIYNNASGTISAVRTGILLRTSGSSLGVLTNAGLINGRTGISNAGSIGSLTNTGVISGSVRGIFNNLGQIGTINNSGMISVAAGAAGAAGGIANGGALLALINTGTIVSSSSSGVGNNQNASSIAQLTNSGLISGATGGLYNQGTMSQITNTGRIIGTQAGIFHTNGTIGTINNSGTISGGNYGISIGAGVFNSLINSGTVSGPIALYLGSGVPALNIANSGVIAGNITNASANALTITGATGAAYGTLTGSTLTNQGTITSTLADLAFTSGNLVLNNHINATGRTVSNTGASLKLNSIVNLTGAYSQYTGTLELTPTGGGLIASGVVDVSGGTIKSSFASTGNYLAGTYTLLSGSSLSLAGATVTINNLTGLYKSVSTISNSLRLTVNNDYVGGTLATLANSAAITSASTGLYVATTGSIGTLSNTGTLGGVQFGVNNRGTIGTLSNAGLITDNNFTALWNQGSIGQLINTGTISNNSWAILNTGTIGTLTNSGVIAGAGNAVQNNAVITLLNNSGTLSGASNAVAGTYGTLANSGLIRGDINKFGGSIATIIGGTGGAIGTFTGFNGTSQGTIGASSNLTFASGALLLNDTITAIGIAASALTISNTGADISLSTIVNINANYRQTGGSLILGAGGKLAVSQAASITGGTIAVNGITGNATYRAGAAGVTLVSGGTGSSYAGVNISIAGVTGIAGSSSIIGNNLLLSVNNDYVGDTQVSIGNTGTISGVSYPLYVANTGSIGTYTNSGALIGLTNGASNNGSIGILSNSGLISGAQKGLGNQGTITNLVNTSIGTILGGTAAGLQNDTSMGTVTNAGLISSGSAGFANYGTLGLLSNSGSINGGPQAIYVDGSIGTIDNSGSVTSGQSGISAGGTLGTLINSGFIGNATNAINLSGTLGTLINAAGGTISGNNALYISGSLGGISNSGAILGRIDNQSANNLTITGGAAGTIGTLSGVSGVGTISNTLSNLVFASGNLLLNDNIIATGRTVSNTGATLSLDSNISITGNYSQSLGTLRLTPGVSSLAVSGNLAVTGGTVSASLTSTNNYLAGTYTLLSGSSLNLSGATVTINNLTGLYKSVSTISNSLRLTVNNDYVGGTLATLANSAAITSASTGLYVATTGSIGTLSNTGTLGGVQFGVNNRGTIGTLSNAGLITNNNFTALWNQGSIGQLINTGTISNNSWAILNTGTIGTLTNSGVIAGAGNAVQNNAVITLLNNSGTLSGASNAVAGTYGTLANSGLIRGDINKFGGSIATIIGGTGGAIGTFTGFNGTSQGTIGASNNLTFASGALLLNDTITAVGISAAALTISNTGANITLATIVNINGNFNQSAGTLNLGTAGKLAVSQAAVITGGTIAAGGFSATGNYLAGANAATLVSGGAGSSYSGVTIDVASVSGLEAGAATSGNALVMAVSNNYVGGSLGTLDNTSSLNATNAVYVAATGSLGTLLNSDTITANVGLANQGTVGTVENSGVFNVTGTGIANNGSIGQINNTGSIVAAASAGIYNSGTIAAINNSGALINSQASAGSGQAGAIVNAGSLGALTNSGTIAGPVALYNSGSLGTIANSGIIAGDIENVAAQDLVFTGGTGRTFGTLTGHDAGSQGTITNLVGNVVMASGGIVLNDAVNVGTGTLINSGATIQLTSIVAVTGNYSQASGTLALGQSALHVSGIASISGGMITSTQFDAAGNYIVGVAAGTLVQGGMGSSYLGVDVQSGINGLSIATSIGTIGSNVNLLLTLQNDYVGGTLANLNNTGTITGVSTAALVAATGSIGTLSNSGVLDGSSFGLNNNGVIDQIANSGTMSGTVGVFNGGTIGTILNTGSMIDTPAILAAGLNNAGVIGAVINQGTISGEARGLYNDGQIGNVTNSGTIAGELALYNGGSIGTLNNSGVLLDSAAPTSAALNNAGTLNVAINSGTITGVTYGILNSGTLGELSNSGTIQAATAIYNSGTLGPIANTGVIAGNIENVSAQDLTFTGASGSDMGTLTGQSGGRGTITNLAGNVVFASGNLLLNDDVVATGHAVTNTGAVLTLQNSAAITGDFSQTAGSLVLATGQQLNVSGAASLTGGSVATTLPRAANYLAGTTAATLVTGGAGSTYTGVSVTTGPITGLAVTTGASGNNLVVTANNNYIGADLASLTNSGSLTADYPVHVAAGGSLGALANSGTLSGSVAAIYNAGTLGPIANTGVIAGNIQNVSAQALTFTGASGSDMGTLTGQNGGRGTITNTGGDVVFASGNLLLNDDVVATGHAVTNTGAVLTLQNSAAITGDFSQMAGSLLLATGQQLNVSGAASLTGGSVATTLPGAANYLAGTTAATLVTGGAGSTYTGVSVTTNPITGLALTSGASGNNLVVTANNHYIGATLDSLTNSGTAGADYGVYIAAGGSLGALVNTGTISGSVAAIRNAGTLGPITNTGVIAGDIENLSSADLRIAGGTGNSFGTLTGFGVGSMGTIRNLSSNVVVTGNLLLNNAVNVGTRSLINNGATLQLNGVVPVTGNYSQTGGTLLVGVTSKSVYGQLQVSGTATLTGATVRVIALGTTAIAAGDSYTVVKAAGGLTFSNVTASVAGLGGSFFSVTEGGSTGLVLSVGGAATPTSFTSTGVVAGGSGVGTGAALDAIADAGGPSATPVITNILIPLAALPITEQQRAIVQLAPTQLTPQVIAVAVSPAVNAIVQHQQVLAANATGREELGLAAGSQGQRGAVWGQLLLNTAKRNVASGASPYAAHTFGVMAGVDMLATSKLTAGVALSWVNSTANGRADLTGSRTKLDSFQATGYFNWQPGDAETAGLTIDGQLGFGYNFYRQSRRIDFLGLTAAAEFEGQQYLGNLRVSYTIPVSETASITPFASVREVHLKNAGYTETGAGTANLQVRKLSVDSFGHEIGLQSAAILNGSAGRFTPSLKIGWVHNYVNGPIPLTAVLGGVAFTSSSDRGARDGATIGAGMTFMQSDRMRIGVQYDGELRRAFQSHTASVKLTVNF